MLVLRKNRDDETWYECMMRYAKEYGLEDDCKEEYNIHIKAGYSDKDAAYYAAEEWDILDYENE
jgi:hypothetical protein